MFVEVKTPPSKEKRMNVADEKATLPASVPASLCKQLCGSRELDLVARLLPREQSWDVFNPNGFQIRSGLCA